jgi:hypothetical protein
MRAKFPDHLTVLHYAVFSSFLALPLSYFQIFSSAPHSHIPSIYVKDHVSHPYKITGKVIFFIYFNVCL